MNLLRNFLSAFAISVLLATSAHADIVSPRQTAHHVGEEVVVEGVVSQVSRSNGGTTFINFGGRFPNHIFYAVIFKNRAHLFPDVFELEGRNVAIKGTIETYKGKPQIILVSPNQVELR